MTEKYKVDSTRALVVKTAMPTGQSPHLLVFGCGPSIRSCFLAGRGHSNPPLQPEWLQLRPHTRTTHLWPRGGARGLAFCGSGVLVGVRVPSGGLDALWSLTILVPEPFGNSGKLRAQQGLGKEAGAGQHGSNPAWRAAPWVALCSFALRVSVVTSVRWSQRLLPQMLRCGE